MGKGYTVARTNPTGAKAKKKAPAKRAAPKKKSGSAIVPGVFVADINGQIFKVTHANEGRIAVRDFDGKEHTYDRAHVRKTAAPRMPGERVTRNGEAYTVISQEFVGIVNARNATTGKRTQLGVRENPIRTLEGRVLTAPGTRKSASKLMLMRKHEIENDLPLTSRIKLSSGKWLTYQSAQWVLSHGRAGSASGPRKKSSAAPRKRGGSTVVQDAFDWINDGFGGSD